MVEFQHDPAQRDHLSHSANFSCPVGFDWNFLVDTIENYNPPYDFEIPGDHENDEPNREVPISSPIHESGSDEARHEKSLVRQRVKYRSRD